MLRKALPRLRPFKISQNYRCPIFSGNSLRADSFGFTAKVPLKALPSVKILRDCTNSIWYRSLSQFLENQYLLQTLWIRLYPGKVRKNSPTSLQFRSPRNSRWTSSRKIFENRCSSPKNLRVTADPRRGGASDISGKSGTDLSVGSGFISNAS